MQCSDTMRCVANPTLARVFAPGDIADLMSSVLDMPMQMLMPDANARAAGAPSRRLTHEYHPQASACYTTGVGSVSCLLPLTVGPFPERVAW